MSSIFHCEGVCVCVCLSLCAGACVCVRESVWLAQCWQISWGKPVADKASRQGKDCLYVETDAYWTDHSTHLTAQVEMNCSVACTVCASVCVCVRNNATGRWREGEREIQHILIPGCEIQTICHAPLAPYPNGQDTAGWCTKLSLPFSPFGQHAMVHTPCTSSRPVFKPRNMGLSVSLHLATTSTLHFLACGSMSHCVVCLTTLHCRCIKTHQCLDEKQGAATMTPSNSDMGLRMGWHNTAALYP